jgi:lysophospholipase L1-like esterase
MGALTDWNVGSAVTVIGVGLYTNATRVSVAAEAGDSVSVWSANNALVTAFDNNGQGAMQAAAGPASATALSLGNYENVLNKGPAVFDGVAWMIWSAVPSVAQLTNMRAAALATFNIAPQANDVWVAQGDSITMGHKIIDLRGYSRQGLPLLQDTIRHYNLGISGITVAAKVAAAQFNLEMPYTYDPAARRFVVTIMIGTNDITANTTGAVTFTNLQTWIAKFKALGPNVRVIVSTITPVAGRLGQQQIEHDAYNNAIRTQWNLPQAAGGLGADGFVDAANDPTMGPSTATADTTLYSDGLHPTALGDSYLAARFAREVASQLTR